MTQEEKLRMEALEREVAELKAWIEARRTQQITLPLDLSSVAVIKAALTRAGFTYP